jgi:hypothetical protein
MRKLPLALSLFAACVILYSVQGQTPTPSGTRSHSVPAATEPVPPTADRPPCPRCTSGKPDDDLMGGLVAILDETKSPDTLLVTVKALADLGPRARSAVPAVIRSAERLGVLKDLLHQKDEQGAVGPAIVELIGQIIKGRDARVPACCSSPFSSTGYAPVPLSPPPPTEANSPLGRAPKSVW